MRVLLLADSLGNGGMERQLALLAVNLPSDWERRVWAMGDGPFVTYLRERGIDVAVCERRARYDPLPALGLWPQLTSWRPDVVHAWSWMSGLAVAPMCRALGIPVVNGIIRSGTVDLDHPRLRRLSLSLATFIVANSGAGLRAWGVGVGRGRVVHNGFDQTRLQGVEQSRHAGAGHFTVVMSGRMTPVKHFDVVIDAARRLSREQDGWRFLLVGDGPDRVRLRRLAQELVQRDVVVFPPPATEVLDVVCRADVGVLMTNPRLAYEGLSNSVMEYMALGLPAVCSDGGGNPELVDEGVTGFIIPPGDAKRLAERLAWLRDHQSERVAMGAAGRAKIRDDLSVAAMVRGMLEVYTEALAPAGRTSTNRTS